MKEEFIEVYGAREHNLKNLKIKIPRNKLVVLTGLSGSGKSSLAFDTIYAEGQRRYLESLSSYARQFLEKLKKPEVDYISGLSPSIAIEQRTAAHNPRSTVATVTEVYDYLRLLFAKAGSAYCPSCGEILKPQKLGSIYEEVIEKFSGAVIQVLAPVIVGRKGEHQNLFKEMIKKGFDQARINGKRQLINPDIKLKRNKRHDIEIIVDDLIPKYSKEDKRLKNSLECAVELGSGSVAILSGEKLTFFSTVRSCVKCHINFPELTPNLFSFNSPYGACQKCRGLGKLSQVLVNGVILDSSKPLMAGALNKEVFFAFNKYFIEDLMYDLTQKYHFDWKMPYKSWSEEAKETFFLGDGDISGLVSEWERLLHETKSEKIKRKIRRFLREDTCPECDGKRLKKETLNIRIDGKNIFDVSELSIEEVAIFFKKLNFLKTQHVITEPIVREIKERINFLLNIGLGYLSLNRSVASLAGGELQRIRIAAQIGLGLTGCLYVLDEPSIGLHPRDNDKLLKALERLRDLKNTVLVVEHDEETIRRADYIIDLGPRAGSGGGEIVAQGRWSDIGDSPKSLTVKYLSKKLKIEVPHKRKDYKTGQRLILKGCSEHNLRGINVSIPLGALVCVTGVSGSGKSTLVHDTLYKELHNKIWGTDYKVGKFESFSGVKFIDKIIEIDQSPIGRTPRSNPVTYTDIFGYIRKLYSELELSRLRRYTPSRFSFNLKGGRCEHCRGEGYEKLEMSFMPDIYVVCDECRSKRYNEATLEVLYQNKNIADVLDMSITEAVSFFSKFSQIKERLELMESIGLGYLKLGQPSTTLSGGEAQRVKIASELGKKATGKTLYLLDEPTTGLHFADIDQLLKSFFRLKDQGNTIVVIEHNLDVIKMADYIIDLGPEGGTHGGRIVAEGSPEEVARASESYTGSFLRSILSK